MRWNAIDQQVCSVARALSVVGDRWTLLILRDAFLGTRRFDQFQKQLGVTRHRLSERLSRLVEQGILVKKPYQQRPVRYEYRLTRKGLALYPVLLSLSMWGDEWMDDGNGAPVNYRHKDCHHLADPQITCVHCHAPLKPADVVAEPGDGLVAALGESVVEEQKKDLPSLMAKTMPTDS